MARSAWGGVTVALSESLVGSLSTSSTCRTEAVFVMGDVPTTFAQTERVGESERPTSPTVQVPLESS